MKNYFLFFFLLTVIHLSQAQENPNHETADSLYLVEVEETLEPDKVLHAEPLFIDLIRDLGARKGEQEWNIGLGITDNKQYDKYLALVEYEWAPINRLGMEVELPFHLYYPTENGAVAPRSKLHSLKLASQYSFLVSPRYKTSMAIGYIHEFELRDHRAFRTEHPYSGNTLNPFFVAAKRWTNHFHSLIYTGPLFHQNFPQRIAYSHWQFNTNLHYMIEGTRNFIGVEFNKELQGSDFDLVIRPQMRLGISEGLMVGIVTGIPIRRENERFSTFLRLIYEPKHKRAG